MGGDEQQPVPGKTDEKTKQSSTTTGTTTGTTSGTSDIQKTLDPRIAAGLQSQFSDYTASTGQLGQDIANWQAAGFSPDQIAGFQLQRDAVGPGGPVQQSLDQLLQTARGDFLTGPARDEQLAAIMRGINPQIASTFGRGGRDQNFLGQEALGRSVADSYLTNVFNPERNRQLQASQLIPGQSLIPGQTMQDIGKQYQDLQQYATNYPISLYPSLFSGLSGSVAFADPFSGQHGTTSGQSSTTQHSSTQGTGSTTGTSTPAYFPQDQNASLLGGIAAGAGAGSAFGPWGALAGGVGGGLLSI